MALFNNAIMVMQVRNTAISHFWTFQLSPTPKLCDCCSLGSYKERNQPLYSSMLSIGVSLVFGATRRRVGSDARSGRRQMPIRAGG